MKTRWLLVTLITAACSLAGCATDSELTQKEKDKLARDMERENRKQAQAQEKMMRGNNSSGLGGQRTGSR